MLTREEVLCVAERFMERVDWYIKNTEDKQKASIGLCNELGVSVEIQNDLVDMLVDFWVDVPPEILRMLSPPTIAALTATLGTGIELGKKIAEISRVGQEVL